jgi:outer membrane protein assembly factor BamA
VSLVGRFNGWDDFATPMQRDRHGVWRVALRLEAGRWPYLFVVDGEWIRDPDNPLVTVPERAAGLDLGETSLVEVRREEVVLPQPPARHVVAPGADGTYDRVNQVSLSAWVKVEDRPSLLPGLTVGGGYSFGRDRWLYDVGVSQPVFEAGSVRLEATAYRRNASPDELRVGSEENTLSAFFLREDWRDHYEAEGYSARARVWLGENVEIETRWTDEDQRSVSKTTDWGVFGGDKRMRVNPPIDEGTLRSMGVGWTFDSRNEPDNPSRGWLANAGWLWAGRDLGGDFAFQRGTVDVRRYLKLAPHQHFDLRIAAGALDQAERTAASGERREGFDAIPVQERFYLGGIGTMRATQFKSIVGDRMALANAEWRVDVFRDLQAAVFADLGDAWIEADDEFDLNADAGVGFQDGDSSFRLNVARKVDDRPGRGDVLVSARIQRMF